MAAVLHRAHSFQAFLRGVDYRPEAASLLHARHDVNVASSALRFVSHLKRAVARSRATPLSLRFTALFLISYLCFAFYVGTDALSSLQAPLLDLFHVTESRFGILSSVYTLPNIVLVVFGVLVIDRFGSRLSLIVFGSLAAVGLVLTALSASVVSFPLLVASRVVFGIGAESAYVVANDILVEWFRHGYLGLATSLYTSMCSLGSVVAFAVLPMLHSDPTGPAPPPTASAVTANLTIPVSPSASAPATGLTSPDTARVVARRFGQHSAAAHATGRSGTLHAPIFSGPSAAPAASIAVVPRPALFPLHTSVSFPLWVCAVLAVIGAVSTLGYFWLHSYAVAKYPRAFPNQHPAQQPGNASAAGGTQVDVSATSPHSPPAKAAGGGGSGDSGSGGTLPAPAQQPAAAGAQPSSPASPATPHEPPPSFLSTVQDMAHNIRAFDRFTYLYFVLVVLIYVTFLPFRWYAADEFLRTYRMTEDSAGRCLSLIDLISLICGPVLGLGIDRFGLYGVGVVLSCALAAAAYALVALRGVAFIASSSSPFLTVIVNDPTLAIVLLGLHSALLPGAFWPACAFIVPKRAVDITFALSAALMNLFLTVVVPLFGVFLEASSFPALATLFTALMLIATAVAAVWAWMDMRGPRNLTGEQK